jgi:hypothetical protein
MPDLPDFDLRRGEQAPVGAPPPRRSTSRQMLALALVVAAAAVAYVLLWRSDTPPQPAATGTEAPGTPAGTAPLGGEPKPVDVPPLGESDPLVRELVGALSSHPRVAAWLATDGLIRNFVVVVENIAYGTNPAPRLQALKPAGTFRTAGPDDAAVLDRQSYDRFDGYAEAAASIDAKGAADLYATLKPRIEEAWAELGRSGSFDAALERAIVVLLQAPVIERPIELTPGPVGYRFSDPQLERLAPAQKQLVRMGPENTRTIQNKLREIAVALGIAAERLPES